MILGADRICATMTVVHRGLTCHISGLKYTSDYNNNSYIGVSNTYNIIRQNALLMSQTWIHIWDNLA